MGTTVSLADIQSARRTLRDVILATPVIPAARLSSELGASVYYKAENTQHSGSFKIRGAYNTISHLSREEKARGVIAPSAGNHAQGVAMAAQLCGVQAVIVMPERAPLTKVVATRRLGAEVVLAGAGFDEAVAHAQMLQEQHGYTYVHAFDHPRVIAGQGTIGFELAEALPDLQTLVVPIGGGGLISGIAIALKALLPMVRIVGVQAAGCAPVPDSLAAGCPIRLATARTIADGIAVKSPGELTLPIIAELVDDVVTVDEDEIVFGIAHVVQNSRLVVEGAGAAGVAALLAGKVALQPGEVVATILCGGNIDSNLLTRALETALVRQGRYLLVRTSVDDRPGGLAGLVNRVAEVGASVLDLFHRRAMWRVPIDRAGVELVLEVRDEEHAQAVLDHLTHHGYSCERGGLGSWPV
ncbi:threonine ammonia-lyase [Candidatus Chloroploca sp. Khr17]|uniref:threonine ammonia-lyase n=1 Tax=Candidatus Chloroploca sp. Khr17 TaxID=2496869 RepID=UPI00101E03B6|nr:threonine ammonia-lyase [Candidatus Chloroploca sp. Khr17]